MGKVTLEEINYSVQDNVHYFGIFIDTPIRSEDTECAVSDFLLIKSAEIGTNAIIHAWIFSEREVIPDNFHEEDWSTDEMRKNCFAHATQLPNGQHYLNYDIFAEFEITDNSLNFVTSHIDHTDIEPIKDVSIFSGHPHLINSSDEYIKVDNDLSQITFHTTNKLMDVKSGEAIEFTIASIFHILTNAITLEECKEMAKAHYFHLEAAFSIESKKQTSKVFKDIFLHPESANIAIRGKGMFDKIYKVRQ